MARSDAVIGQFVRFVAAFVVYAVIDVAWNVSPIALGMYARIHAAADSPLEEIGKSPMTWGASEGLAILAFFALIALANSRFAIEPALRENSIGIAMRNSALLGCAAYATYIVPIYMSIANWPGVLVPIDIIIGGLLSLITSTAIVWLTLRIRGR